MKGSKNLAKAIRDLGIKRVYLYPGGTIAPLLDDLVNYGIEYFCGVTEQGAGYAAIGAAKINNEPQVVIVTSGPGATNLVSPVADAYYDSVPLIVITGQVSIPDINWDKKKRQTGFQETDTVGIYNSITKSSKILTKEMDLYDEVNMAYNLSLDKRMGPVHLDIPMNVQREETKIIKKSIAKLDKLDYNISKDCKKLINLIDESERPLILHGNGIYLSNACIEFQELITKTNIPTVSSMPGVGVFDTKNQLYKGYIGHTGEFYANLAMHFSDLLIVIGARLDVRQTGSEVHTLENKIIVHIDIDEAEIKNPRLKTDLKINCDAKQFLKTINKSITKKNCSEWILKIDNWKIKYHSSLFYQKMSLSSFHIISETNKYLENNNVVVSSGVGTHQQLVARYFNFKFPQKRWLTSAGHGTMGYDLPTAIGALVNNSNFDYGIVFVGDGSFQMNIQELANVKRYNLPIKIFVLDNNRLGIVSQFQLLNWDSDQSTGSKNNPPFDKIGNAYGIDSFVINSKKEKNKILQKVFSNRKPNLIHCKIDEKEDVFQCC